VEEIWYSLKGLTHDKNVLFDISKVTLIMTAIHKYNFLCVKMVYHPSKFSETKYGLF